jgi:hypothetical protein
MLLCGVTTDLLMQVEGSRVLALVPTDGSYFQDVAVQSGDWTDPATWQNDSTPKSMDNVLIPQGINVAISSDVSKDAGGQRVAIHALRVDGTLSFGNSSPLEKLLVDTIVVTGPTVANPNQMGTIEIGTPSNPIPQGVTAQIVFADNGPINAPANTNSALSTLWPDGDPYELSRGLIVMGNATLDGTEVTSEEPVQPDAAGVTDLLPGTTTLTLASTPTNWNVGDQIDVTGDRRYLDGSYHANLDEQTTIQSLATDPVTGVTTITINTPLQYLHHAPAGASIYVANLTRNVMFESENSDIQDRGHVMFMHAVNPEQVYAVGFYGLGRTDKSTPINDPKPIIDPSNPGTADHPNYIESPGTGTNPRGRYAVHFHHDCQTGNPDTINDCAVDGSPGWGIVNHSSNVAVTNNVVYDVFGAAYVTEAGDELGTFDRNIAIIHLPGDPGDFGSRNADGDFGFEGDGFWFQGGDIGVTNNIAANTSNGFFFFPAGLVQHLPVAVDSSGNYIFQDVTTRIPVSELAWLPPSYVAAALNDYGSATGLVKDNLVPLKLFSNNVALATDAGFQAWVSQPLPGADSIIDGLHIYMSTGVTIQTPYSTGFVFNNLVDIGDVNDPGSYGAGYSTNSTTDRVTFNNPDIEGFAFGFSTPTQGLTTINGGTLKNILNIRISPANVAHDLVNGVMVNDNQVVTINNVAFTLLPAPAWWTSRGLPHYNVYYPASFNLAQPDLGQLYDPNVGNFSAVTIDGRQLYYHEQASDFVPFLSATKPPNIPSYLLDLTNAQILARYGLAIGGAVAPADAVVDPPGIYGILGDQTAPPPIIDGVLGDQTAPPPIIEGPNPFASLPLGTTRFMNGRRVPS